MWTLLLLTLCTCISVTSAASHVVRRSDDTNPLEAVVNNLAQEVTSLKAELQALKNAGAKRAAFHATLGKDPTPNSPIHFNLPEQLGAGFDTATGIYTAPYSGWYTFEFQLFPRATALVNVDLIRNGGLVARARCDDEPDYSTCSSGITLHVNEGDKIWLQTNFGGPYNMAYFDNIFSGVLVIPDP